MLDIDRDRLAKINHSSNNFFAQGFVRLAWGITGVNGLGQRLEPGPAEYYLWAGARQLRAALRMDTPGIQAAEPVLYAQARRALVLCAEQVQASDFTFRSNKK